MSIELEISSPHFSVKIVHWCRTWSLRFCSWSLSVLSGHPSLGKRQRQEQELTEWLVQAGEHGYWYSDPKSLCERSHERGDEADGRDRDEGDKETRDDQNTAAIRGLAKRQTIRLSGGVCGKNAGLSKEVARECKKLVEVMQPLDVHGDWDILSEDGFERASKASSGEGRSFTHGIPLPQLHTCQALRPTRRSDSDQDHPVARGIRSQTKAARS